jgi:hypothetical protein
MRLCLRAGRVMWGTLLDWIKDCECSSVPLLSALVGSLQEMYGGRVVFCATKLKVVLPYILVKLAVPDMRQGMIGLVKRASNWAQQRHMVRWKAVIARLAPSCTPTQSPRLYTRR